VVAITEDQIRELAGFKGVDAPVTTCYLDVDGRRHVRHQDYEHELEKLIRDARQRANGDRSVAADLARIEEYVKGGLDRSNLRGLALFSCTAHDFWRVIELPVPVRSQLVVNHTPYVRQLEVIVDEYERFGVLLADRQRARLFLFELGELVESEEMFEELPRDEDVQRTHLSRGGHERVESHVAEHAHQHLRNAADLAFRLFQEKGFEHLIIGAPDEIAHELETLLHAYLKERLAGRVAVPVNASDAEICSAALEVEAEVERRQEAELVERLRDSVGAGRRGVAGLPGTLQALVERRVETLLVSHGYEAPGWRCKECSFIGTRGRACPVCSNDMDQVDDVVEEAVEDALAQSCQVNICHGNADLDVLGRIGALLRY
jgi:peptide chain release factor subunit 1